MDLTTLTEEQLGDHLNAVLAEQERRQRLAAMPAQMAEMAARYVADGGARGDLIEAVTGPPTADTTA